MWLFGVAIRIGGALVEGKVAEHTVVERYPNFETVHFLLVSCHLSPSDIPSDSVATRIAQLCTAGHFSEWNHEHVPLASPVSPSR